MDNQYNPLYPQSYPSYVPVQVENVVKYVEQKVKGHTRNDPVKEELDPISILALVALLPFTEGYNITYWNDFWNGRQVSIVQSSSTVRRITGQSHEDLDIIGIAIQKIKESYLNRHAFQIQELFNQTLKGLDRLIELYDKKGSGITRDALNHYKSLIELAKPIQDNKSSCEIENFPLFIQQLLQISQLEDTQKRKTEMEQFLVVTKSKEKIYPNFLIDNNQGIQENKSVEETKQSSMLKLWGIDDLIKVTQHLRLIGELEDKQKRQHEMEQLQLLITQKQKINQEIWK